MAKNAKNRAAVTAVIDVQHVPLCELVISPRNVRQTPPQYLKNLAESIAAHGLLQNLTVIPRAHKGASFEVIAGGRRLHALQMLAAEGRIANDYHVPCAIAEPHAATEISLAENQQRESLNPIDEAEAFARLIREEKRKPAAVALAYGVSKRYVEQRLKLADLAPEVKVAARFGALPMLAAQAFTITDDTARQVEVLNQLEAEGYLTPGRNDGDDDIAIEVKERLASKPIASHHRLVKFIGLDAYLAAGGELVNDLFSAEDEPPLLKDGALVESLAKKKLAKEAKKIAAKGWAWAVIHPYWTGADHDTYGHTVWPRLRPETAEETAEREQLEAELRAELTDERREQIAARLDAIEDARNQFTAEEKALLGVIVDVDFDGTLEVDKGWLIKENAEAFHALRNPKKQQPEPDMSPDTYKPSDTQPEEEQEPHGAPAARVPDTMTFGVTRVRSLYDDLIEVKDYIRDGKTGGGNRDYLLTKMQEILDELAARLLEV